MLYFLLLEGGQPSFINPDDSCSCMKTVCCLPACTLVPVAVQSGNAHVHNGLHAVRTLMIICSCWCRCSTAGHVCIWSVIQSIILYRTELQQSPTREQLCECREGQREYMPGSSWTNERSVRCGVIRRNARLSQIFERVQRQLAADQLTAETALMQGC